MKIWKKERGVLLAPIPALLIGAIAMQNNHLSPFVYGQNILCYLIFGFLFLLFGTKPVRVKCINTKAIALMMIVGCALMAFTFLDHGLQNVHRWLAIGSFRLYISSIVLPSMIIGLGVLFKSKSVALPVTISALLMLLLGFQPDASQLSAFGVSITLLVWMHVKQRPLKFGIALLSVGLMIYSWLHLDTLEAVPHAEDILFLAKDIGIVWFCLAIASLVVMLTPLLCFPDVSVCARAVGLYYFLVLLSTFFGNFPVPIMGFGISPLIGYMLAMLFLLRGNVDSGAA